MRRLGSILSILFCPLLFTCSNTALTSSSINWDLTVDHLSQDLRIVEQKVAIEPDGGLLLTFLGESDGATVVLSVNVSGGATIGTTGPLNVGSSAVNVQLTLGATTYRGTSGTILFSSYGTEEGNEVTGTVAIGFVGFSLVPTTSAQIVGDFSAIQPGQIS